MLTTVYDYVEILKELQTIAPDTHIAGGACRDTLLKKPIHDVDIFLDDKHVDEAAKLLRSRFKFVKVGEWAQYAGFSDPAMTRVAKFEKAEETIPLCIIGLESEYADPQSNVDRFDFGLCMTWYDGQNIERTAVFDSDVENKTFTLYRADNEYQFAYSMSRFNKITANRYAGYKLTIAGEFLDYLKDYEVRRRWYVNERGDFCGKGFDGESVLKPKERVAA